MREEISITFDGEKLCALEMVLKKEHSTVRQHLNKTLEELYERKVPEPVREFIDRKAAAKPKRPPRTDAKSTRRVEEAS